MNKEEAIKYLQQLYPNGGHCWLDEQRIEAIGMAINALQEEPVSEQNLSNVERTGKNWKEPVSEELEEAAKRYATEGDEISGLYVIDEEVDAFKAGANWQKKQDQSTIELAEDHAMLAGMEKMKEEMMAKAVDAVVETDANGLACINVDGVDVGDKVKVIVIKEDKDE